MTGFELAVLAIVTVIVVAVMAGLRSYLRRVSPDRRPGMVDLTGRRPRR